MAVRRLGAVVRIAIPAVALVVGKDLVCGLKDCPSARLRSVLRLDGRRESVTLALTQYLVFMARPLLLLVTVAAATPLVPLY